MKQIYHPYTLWEDWKAGMWRTLPKDQEQPAIEKAIEFTGNHELYGEWMLRVIHEWPLTCEHNLTNLQQNRKAFIGHCAAQMAINSPEYITRKAWWFLTKEQQDLANQQAQNAILAWEQKQQHA